MNRKQIIQIGLVILIPLVLLIGLLSGPAIVTIEADSGATISVATEKDGSFKQIGKTKVTRILFDRPDNLYFSAQLNGKQTIASIKPQWFSRQSLKLELANLAPAKKISEGALRDVIFSGDKGQGIAPGQDTLINFSSTSADERVNPALVTLPYIREVIWYDYINFVYLADDGLGQFIGGEDRGFSGVGTSISGDVLIDSEYANEWGRPIITDMSKSPGKPLVLLSNNNIFTSADMGSKLFAITSFDLSLSDTNIFTSGDSIFKVTGARLSDDKQDDEANQEAELTIEEFSYSGKRLGEYALDEKMGVVNIVKNNGTTYILTLSGLHTIRDGVIQKNDLYFSTPADMTLYKDQVVVLADDALWRIGAGGKSFQLLFKFSNYGVGLAGSLTVDPNNQLILGTRPEAASDTDNSATFSLSF